MYLIEAIRSIPVMCIAFLECFFSIYIGHFLIIFLFPGIRTVESIFRINDQAFQWFKNGFTKETDIHFLLCFQWRVLYIPFRSTYRKYFSTKFNISFRIIRRQQLGETIRVPGSQRGHIRLIGSGVGVLYIRLEREPGGNFSIHESGNIITCIAILICHQNTIFIQVAE